ncbi:MAG TPA: PAS domain S-box protein, partial [Chitinophagaceae bacterium]|nr:PAS domain S-box protein [Chitinophagaceae bacterium]
MKLYDKIFTQRDEALKLLIEHITIGIILADTSGRIALANPHCQKIFGYATDELAGQPINVLIPDFYRSRQYADIQAYFTLPHARQMAAEASLFGQRKTGKTFPVEISLNMLPVNEQVFAAVFIRDITDEKTSIDKFSKIFYESPVAIILSDVETGKILEANGQFCEMCGYSPQELIGYTSTELDFFLNAEDRPALIDKLNKNGKVRNIELPIRDKYKRVIWASLSAERLMVAGRECMLTTCRDISDFKTIKEKLEADEQRIRVLVEHTPAAVAMLDTGMNYIVVSNRWMKDYDLPGNITGRNHYEVFPAMPAEWKHFYQRCLAGETLHSDEDSFITKDGVVEWLKWELCPWYSRDHNIGGLIIFSEVITKEKKYIEALKESEMKLSAEATALAQLNEAGITLWQQQTLEGGLQQMLAYSTQLFGATMGHVQLVNPEKDTLAIVASKGCASEFLQYFAEIGLNDLSVCSRALKYQRQICVEDIEKDEAFVQHLDIARKSGFRAVQSTPLPGKDGIAIGIISTHFKNPYSFNPLDLKKMELYAQKAAGFLEHFKTLGDLKAINIQLENKVQERTKDLILLLEREKEINELKSRFVSIASHEFRTPLSIILSSADLIEAFEKTPGRVNVQKHVLRIKSSVKNLTNILESFLSLEKLEQGRVEVIKKNFDFKQFSFDLLDEIAAVLKKGQVINYRHYGQEIVLQDKQIIKDILINLLSNA